MLPSQRARNRSLFLLIATFFGTPALCFGIALFSPSSKTTSSASSASATSPTAAVVVALLFLFWIVGTVIFLINTIRFQRRLGQEGKTRDHVIKAELAQKDALIQHLQNQQPQVIIQQTAVMPPALAPQPAALVTIGGKVPRAMKCPTCGAPVPVRGNEISIRCTYCNSVIVLE